MFVKGRTGPPILRVPKKFGWYFDVILIIISQNVYRSSSAVFLFKVFLPALFQDCGSTSEPHRTFTNLVFPDIGERRGCPLTPSLFAPRVQYRPLLNDFFKSALAISYRQFYDVISKLDIKIFFSIFKFYFIKIKKQSVDTNWNTEK